MKVGITGMDGFIGKHLSLMVSKTSNLELIFFERDFFRDEDELKKFVEKCDVIVHAAGINRHQDEDFLFATNVDLSKKLIRAATLSSNTPHLIYLSSTHRDRETAYGKSKKHSESLFKEYHSKKGGGVSILILPNIFGEEQRPHYNSVVATFTEEIITGLTSKINPVTEIEFLHVRHVVIKCIELIQKRNCDCKYITLDGIKLSVADLYAHLTSFKDYLKTGIIPDLKQTFEIDLFNSFRYAAAVREGYQPFKIELKGDDRGTLFEVLRTETRGQVFSSITKPGCTRGGHFHTRKIERFCVIEGSALIECVNQFTSKRHTIDCIGQSPKNIDMLTYHYHSIKNVGVTDLRTLFWTNEHFDVSNTDTFS